MESLQECETEYPRIRLDGAEVGLSSDLAPAVVGPELAGLSCRRFVITACVNNSLRASFFPILHEEGDDCGTH